MNEATGIVGNTGIVGAVERRELFFQEGSSDKFYHISLYAEIDGTYSVPFTYGRRGSAGNDNGPP